MRRNLHLPRSARNRAIGPTLKWIQLLSAGVDHALHGRLADSVAITSASGIHAAPIAEYTIASMLSFAHRFHQLMRAQMRHEWGRNGDFMASVDVLRGKTICWRRARDSAARSGIR